MPKQGGQGKGKPKMKDRGFGKALMRKQAQGEQGLGGLSTSRPKGNLSSMLDTNSLDDFVNTAIMDERELEVKKVHKNDTFLVEPTTHKNMQTLTLGQYDYEHLKIPRKPAWTKEMTAVDIDRREREAFLQWRREIASMEDTESNIRATPFEKNIEVWRQLWRVLEKCDIAVQIVDARNPLLYYSKDLMTYANEHNPPRPMLILVNKADYLSPKQRFIWAQYLTELGIKFAFYSAQIEQQKIDDKALTPKKESKIAKLNLDTHDSDAEESDDNQSNNSVDDEDDDDEEDENEDDDDDDENDTEAVDEIIKELANIWNFNTTTTTTATTTITTTTEKNSLLENSEPALESEYVWGDGNYQSKQPTIEKKISSNDKIRKQSKVLNRAELIYFLTNLPQSLGILPQERHRGHICVGLVGFPNVGKSSVINTILGVSKSSHGVLRVGVSSTPGKTKHFQTLDINEDLMLCDCPGLVFPSFMRSRGDMICAGILPINQMRDYVEPANIITSRIPQHLLEAAYGIHIRRDLDIKDNPNRPPTGSEFLSAYCAVKGYITSGTGRWDEFRACKEVLRDFNDGKILYVAPPPPIVSNTTNTTNNYNITMDAWLKDTEITMSKREIVANRIAQKKLLELDLKSSTLSNNNNNNDSNNNSNGNNNNNEIQMVFGEGDAIYELDPSDEYEVYDESNVSESVNEDDNIGVNGKPKREHKRLKHWGKKNRKLRDKNPYDDSKGVYIVHTTNRNGILKTNQDNIPKKTVRTRREDPHYSTSHETKFIVRAHPIPSSVTPTTTQSST